MHQSPGYGAIICNAAVFQWFAPIYALYAPGYSGYIVYYIQLCSNDMHLDTHARQYGADRKKRGCRRSRLRRDCRQLFHRDLNSRVTIIASQSSWLSGLVTINASRTSHPGPITHQTSQQLHRLASERRRPHQNNNHMDVGLSGPVNPLFDTNSPTCSGGGYVVL